MAIKKGPISLLLPLVLLLAAPGCSSSVSVAAARRADWAGLKQHLADDLTAGRIDGGEARRVAAAVATREVTEGQGVEGAARIDEVRACAMQLRSALVERAEKRDEAGARAALVLIDEGLVSRGRWADRVDAEDGAWRAAGARSLSKADAGDRRRAMFLDVHAEVRKAALRAAIDAADPGDVGALLEVVRLDPEPNARLLAAQAIGVAAEQAGQAVGAEAAQGLFDRWQLGDDRLRAAIVSAWGASAVFDAGGREHLVRVAEREHGAAAVIAGSALLERSGDDRASGRGALLRALEGTGMQNKTMAIQLARLDDEEQKKAVIKASESSEVQVRVAALSRLVSVGDQRARALDELGKVAASQAADRAAARAALARAGDRRVVQLLVEDLGSSEAPVRAWAAQVLASMKEFPHAAQALADGDASVRVKAACALLAMPK